MIRYDYTPTPAAALRTGDIFKSPRDEEGHVEVVCNYGRCTHDRRPQSIHVRGNNGNQWFIALSEHEPMQRMTGGPHWD